MKVSEITDVLICDYLRLDYSTMTTAEKAQISAIHKAAVEYIKSYTGLDAVGIDLHEDMIIAVYVLCQDMYDNRSMYVDDANVNKVVETILGMHSVNLL